MSSRARAVSFHEPNGKKATDAELDEIFERMQARGMVVSTKKQRVSQNSVKVIKDVTRGRK